MLDRYRRWLDYELDAHERAIASLESIPTERRTDPTRQKAADLLGHVFACRLMWLHRFGALEDGPSEVFPHTPVESLPARAREAHRAWRDFLERTDRAGLERAFEYRSFEGQRFRNTVEDICTQLFGHSSYHRGQVAAIVRGLGGEPAPTDFVLWSREPVT